MEVCYKTVLESPRLPRHHRRTSCTSSPRKQSSLERISIGSSTSRLVNKHDYEAEDSILDCIPEREWRLIAALARKRDENDEREFLSEQFNKLWQKEKEERANLEAESLGQYKRYLHAKREQERSSLDHLRYRRFTEQQLKRGQLLEGLSQKEKRSAYILARRDDKKTIESLDRVIEEEARAALAADRRTRIIEADNWRKRVELFDGQQRADEARRRRNAILKEASQRLAISNALTMWETTLLREDVCVMEANRRASHAARAALKEARSARLLRARQSRLTRARRLAAVTAQMREAVRFSSRRS